MFCFPLKFPWKCVFIRNFTRLPGWLASSAFIRVHACIVYILMQTETRRWALITRPSKVAGDRLLLRYKKFSINKKSQQSVQGMQFSSGNGRPIIIYKLIKVLLLYSTGDKLADQHLSPRHLLNISRTTLVTSDKHRSSRSIEYKIIAHCKSSLCQKIAGISLTKVHSIILPIPLQCPRLHTIRVIFRPQS